MTCICSWQMELHRNFYEFLNMLSPTGALPMVYHPQSLTARYSPNGTLEVKIHFLSVSVTLIAPGRWAHFRNAKAAAL